MKTRILITGLAFVSAISFGQKREIKKAEKALKDNSYNEALDYLSEAEPTLGSVDNSMKAQFYAAKGEALLGSAGSDFAKLNGAASAFSEAISLDPTIEAQLASPLQNLRAALINSAVADQKAQRYDLATQKLYTSYKAAKNPSDLYFAASSAMQAKDFDTAVDYYKILHDSGYTGETKEFVATNKETGEVEAFDSENVRNIAVKSGQFIKPETQVAESRKGEILYNMAVIYLEKGDDEKAADLIKDARLENPDDVNLMKVEADLSNRMGDYEKSESLMNKIIATDPNNPEIYASLGVANAEMGNREKAIEYYNKALELNPNFEVALINISVVKLSYEDEIREEMNNLGTSRADNEKYESLKKQLDEVFKDALPYLESVHKISPSNEGVVRTIMNIYGNLGNDAKTSEMKAKLEALESQD